MLDVKEQLTKFIETELLDGDVEGVEPDEDLLIAGKVDSIGMMRIVAFIEGAFGYAVPPEDVVIENFMSINSIAEYVGRSTKA